MQVDNGTFRLVPNEYEQEQPGAEPEPEVDALDDVVEVPDAAALLPDPQEPTMCLFYSIMIQGCILWG